jgi:hypothetical protein
MNARFRHAEVMFVYLILVFFVSRSYGQESFLPDQQLFQAQIDHQKILAATWETRASIEFFLLVLVVVLGAVVALLQKVDEKKWCSYAVAVSGIAISTLTFISKEYFEVDHKTYRRNAEAVKRELLIAETYLAMIKAPDTQSEDKRTLLKNVATIIAKIDSVVEGVEKTGAPKLAALLNFIDAAYAQAPSRPAWVSQPKTETTTSYRYVATSAAASIATAQSQAQLNAQNAAVSDQRVSFDTVKRYSILADMYLEYNAQQRIYLCHVMVELNKAFVRR